MSFKFAMCPKRFTHQRGAVSLVFFVLLVVIMGTLSVALVKLTATSNVSIGNEAMSLRAFYAAESGAQNAMASLFPLAGGGGACPGSNPSIINFPAAGDLGLCNASVACTGPTAIGTQNFYTLTSTGTCTAGEAIAVRQTQVGARN